MFITVISTTNYNEKQTMDSWSKQTQSNPTCTELVEVSNPNLHLLYKKRPCYSAGPMVFSSACSNSAGTYVDCFGPLLPLCRLVLHRLVLMKRPQPIREIRVMDKQIITATVRSDKTISFSLTEPFYFTFFQNFFSLGPLLVLQCNLPRIFSQEYAFEG